MPTVIPDDGEVAEPTERELEMAKQLVEALASDFEPTSTTTRTASSCCRSSNARRPARRSSREPQVEEPGKVLDLMAALEPSLARAGRGSPDEGDAEEEELPPAASAKRATKKKTRTRKSA